MPNHYDMDAPSFKYTKQPQKEKRMFDITTPAGNHVIKDVQYDAPKSLTRLILASGAVVWVPMVESHPKVKAGDYYVVSTHGYARFFKKEVLENAVKRASTIKVNISDYDEYMHPKELAVGMREENGYVDKPKNTFTTPSEVAKDFIEKRTKKITDLRERCDKQASTIQGYQTSIRGLQDQINIQAAEGTWDYDEYMRGMLNGLLCARSNFTGEDPQYKEAPPKRVNPVSISKAGTVTVVEGHVSVHDFDFSTSGPVRAEDLFEVVMDWVKKQYKAL